MIKVAATADIHSPKNINLLRNAAHRLKDVDLLILAGDLIYKGRVEAVDELTSILRDHFHGLAVACFGNEEFDEVKERLRERTRSVLTWLDDESMTVTVKDLTVGLVGTRGCLDQPTSWQLRNIPDIKATYAKRAERVEQLLASLSCDFKILFSHYALCKETLKGERPSIWSQLGCSKMEEVVRRQRPTVAIHGHVHNGKVFRTWLQDTLVLNVSLPAVREIVVFDLPLQPLPGQGQLTLSSFL